MTIHTSRITLNFGNENLHPRCVQLIVCGQVFVINVIKLTSFIYIIINQENVCDSSNMGVIINKIVQTHTTPGLTRRQSTGTFKCNAIL
jgi:hypothetical protein